MSTEQQNAALKTIFGSDAVRAASVLYRQGADGIQGWIDKVNDTGYAAETAATRMDNLKGDLEQLRGSLETAFIGTGDSAQGPLRELVQTMTDLVNAYSKLPGPVKTSVLVLTGLAGAVGLGTFALTRMLTAIATTRTNLATLGIQARSASQYLTFSNVAKGSAILGGLAVAQSGLADKINLTNTATYGLMGALTGPYGAAIAGSIGLVKDAAAVNNDLS